jgi:hypothetical protein
MCLLYGSQPLVSGSLLQLWGTLLPEGSSWVVCKSQLLEEYFPNFYRESLLRDLIVFNFHGEVQSMRTYVEIFQAADFLQYEATEQQLVDRLVMNFHSDILRQTAFLDKPRSVQDLHRVAGLGKHLPYGIKRRRLEQGAPRGNVGRVARREEPRDPRGRHETPTEVSLRCWNCGQLEHFRRE